MYKLVSLAVLCLRIAYFPFKLFLKPRKKITLLSRQSDTATVDFMLLEKALKGIGFDGEVVMLCKKISSGIIGKVKYVFHMFAQMYHIATSSVVVLDGYCITACALNHKKTQKFVQIWHALNIVKKFGFGALDKPWGRKSGLAKAMCMHRNYTHIIACSEKSAEVLAEYFNATKDKMVLLPLPRIDYILNSAEKREEIEKAYPDILDKPILLYAPTFRGEKVSLSWIEKAVDLSKYNVVVKLHPADKHGIDENVPDGVLCDGQFSSFEWMKVCDSLVTDYSGMGFEAMLLDKKVYFYLYDYKEYTANNGLSIDLFSEKVNAVVAQTPQDLKKLLEKEYNYSLTSEYVEKYLSVGTHNCAERLAQFLVESIV